MTKYYAGIGSRETPKEICDIFQNIGEHLAKKKYTLRSGGAEGADQAFEVGCNRVKGPKEIFIPWKGFNQSDSTLIGSTDAAQKLAEEVISWWDELKKWPKIIHGRNVYQVLGQDLKTPIDFLVCWTENAKFKGGTATALKLAKNRGIKIYNFGSVEQIKEFEKDLEFTTGLYENF